MKIKLWVSITIVVLIISSLLWVALPGKSEKQREGDTANINYDKLDEIVFDVRTKPVIKGDLFLYINANGIVRATEEL